MLGNRVRVQVQMLHVTIDANLPALGPDISGSLSYIGEAVSMITTAGRDRRTRGVSLASFRSSELSWPPVAIPSKGREEELCCQTLTMLQRYGWDLKKVHVFLDYEAKRSDRVSERVAYDNALQAGGFQDVQLHAGGCGLCAQYNAIFEAFKGTSQLVVLSDTVPRLFWRKKRSLEKTDFPLSDLLPLVCVGFHLINEFKVRAWSLGPCKNVRNMQPGVISLKCGLLDGNFFGVDLAVEPLIRFTQSGFTTDVEFSAKVWSSDGGMIRFLGISAAHTYRSAGGHNEGSDKVTAARQTETRASLRELASKYPTVLQYIDDKVISPSGMNYRFLSKGPSPLKLFGSYTLRGRPTQTMGRPLTAYERNKRYRQRLRAGSRKQFRAAAADNKTDKED